MKSSNVQANLDSLHLSDVYSLMFFLLYKTRELPEYATLSELCYLLDGNNASRLLTYFAGKTVKFPTAKEMVILTNALLLYKYVEVDGRELTEARNHLQNLTERQIDDVTNLYVKLIPYFNEYNIDRGQISKNDRH